MVNTLFDVYQEVKKSLLRAGISSSALEAREICAKAFDISKDELFKKMQLYLTDETEEKIRNMLKRRLEGEPLAYILGNWSFYSMDFKVSRDTLIPRPDTETLVDAALSWGMGRGKLRVLDLCCGCGCVGLAIANSLENTRVVLADISEGALKIARENIALYNLSGRVYTVFCDVFRGPLEALDCFDMIVCNPPYIAKEEMETLDRSVKNFEPRLALYGGEDGLSFYKAIASKWKSAVKEGGALFLECGYTQAKTVQAILTDNAFSLLDTVNDLTGTPRVVRAIK